MLANANKKSHRIRKSAGSNEVWKKQKKARNAARPKQRYVVTGSTGYWTREA